MSVEQQLHDIQSTLLNIRGDQGRMEGKLDGVLREQDRIAGYTASISKRVGKVENKMSRLTGWATAVALFVSSVASLLFRKVLG